MKLAYCSDSALVHHGILGMKHGQRRYQNRDGTLTELGKQRRRKGKKNNKIPDESRYHQDYRNARKDYHEMSDKELQSSVNRLRNEVAYSQLTRQLGTGKSKANRLLSQMGNNFVNNTANAVVNTGSQMASKAIAKYAGVAAASLTASYVAYKKAHNNIVI